MLFRSAKDIIKDPFPFLSVLACESQHAQIPKPSNGDIVIGRINKFLRPILAPSLMLNLRGCIGRCCITELDEPDGWVNMPLEHLQQKHNGNSDKSNDDDGINQNNEGRNRREVGMDNDAQNDM